MAAGYGNHTEIIDTDANNSVTVTVPASLASGEMWVILAAVDSAGSSLTFTTPTGFTQIGSEWSGADAGFPECVAYYKIAGASESSATLSYTGTDFDAVVYSIRITKGANDTLSLDATGTPATPAGNGTTVDAPDITIGANDSLAILFSTVGGNGGTTDVDSYAPPSGSTERDVREDTYPSTNFATQAVNAGSFAPGTFSWTPSLPNRTAQTFSIKSTVILITKTIGSTGVFSTPQLWEDGAPANLTTAEKSSAGTFLVASFTQGESLTFVGSGATGKFLHTDSTGPGTGTYVIYGLVTGNVATSDVCTGGSSGATCIISSGTPTDTGVIWEGHAQNQEFTSASDTCTVSGSTTSSTAYKHLTTAPGASFRDHANAQTNALRYNASNGAAINTTTIGNSVVFGDETNFRISKLQLAPTVSGSRALRINVGGEIAEFCILEGTNTGATTTNGTLSVASNGIVRNCVIVLRSTAADHIVGTGTGSPFFYNCTFAAPDDLATAPTSIFLSGASGTVTVQNCGIFAGDSTKAIKAGSATFNFTTCYSDISGTSGVTQTTYSSEFQNVNDATRDFRLKSGAAQIGTGTTDATNAKVDIAGSIRPKGSGYDVGCWEFFTADSASYTVVKTIGSTGVFSTPQLWEDGAPAALTTAKRYGAVTFSGTFTQGETLNFASSGAAGKYLDGTSSTDDITFGITSGTPVSGEVATGATSNQTAVISGGTPLNTGVIWEGQCQNEEFSGTGTQLTITGSTNSATAYKKITTVAGASFRDNIDEQTNALRYNASNGCGIRGTSSLTTTIAFTEDNAKISNLQIASTGSSSPALAISGNGKTCDFCIIEGTYVGGDAAQGTLSFTGSNTIRNSVIVQRAQDASFHVIGCGTGTKALYNCTIVIPDDIDATGLVAILNSGASGTVTVQNCGLFAGDSTKAIKAGSATFNFTTCYSDISGTSGVTQTTYSSEFQNVNDATRDFRLVTGAAMKDTGTTDTTNAANDIVGTARPSGSAYDVGCWEFVQGAVEAPSLHVVQSGLRW